MGINRYEHIPQYNTPILPYDLVMKAADMKQQRWDKAVGTAQEDFNDIFSKTKVISTSEDERVVLPELRKQFNDELNKMVSDPSMTAEQLSIRANGLVSSIQPSLNKVNDAYTLHTTALTEKMKNEGNAEWSSTNQYVGGPDLFNWNSLKNGDLSQLNYKSRTSIEPVVRPYLNSWAETTLGQEEYRDPTTGRVSLIEKKGKDFAGLLNVAKVNSLDYMNTNNFHQWKDDYKGVKPDDILKDTPGYTQTFGGKKFEELSSMDQAKAMIMFQGVKQINSDASKLAGSTGNGSAAAAGLEAKQVTEPWAIFKSSTSIDASEIASSAGFDINKQWDNDLHAFTGVSIDPNTTFNSPATIAEYSTPELSQSASIYDAITSTVTGLGQTLSKLRQIQSTPGYNPEVKFGDIVGNAPSALTPGKFAQNVAGDAAKRSVDLKQSESQLLAEAKKQIEEFKADPNFLTVQREALKAGIDISTTEGLTKLVTDYGRAQVDLAANQTVQLGKNLMGLSSATWQPMSGSNNVYNIGDRKFAKGKILIPATDAGYETIKNALEKQGADISSKDIFPNWTNYVGGNSNEVDAVVDRMDKEGILKIEDLPGKNGEMQKYITIPTSIEVPMNNPATVSRYNRAKAGNDALLTANLQSWEQNYASNRAQENLNELSDRIVNNPKLATNFVTGINNFILNTSTIDKDIRTSASQTLTTLVNSYTQKPNKQTAEDLVSFQQALQDYANGRYSKENFQSLLDGTTSNPKQPQGATTSNSMGIPRKR